MLEQFSSPAQQQQQQQQQAVTPVNKVSPQIQDTRQMMVPPSYNSNMMIQSAGTTSYQRQQQQQTQPPSYQSSVIAKNVKHTAIKSQQQQQQAQGSKMVFGKRMDGIYQGYQTQLQEMGGGGGGGIQNAEEDPLASE